MKRFLTLLVGVVALFSLSACNPLIIGDSISYLSDTEYKAAMPNVMVNAVPGRTVEGGLAPIQENLQYLDEGGWLVVELGANNIDAPHAERMRLIKQVTDQVPDDVCLAWVTPYVMSFPGILEHDNAGWMTDITEGIKAQPCHTVVYWNLVAEGNPQYMQDFVHPNEAGQQALAFFIAIATDTYEWPP